MYNRKATNRSVESVKWQDYRGKGTGMVIYYSCDPVSELPIREIPEEIESDILPEPHYESGTYGLYGCARQNIRAAFVKEKSRYLFFMTKYVGTNPEYQDKIIVSGYYRIGQTADAKKFHIRYCGEYTCLDIDSCPALRADEVHFVSLDDCMLVDSEILKAWGYGSRVTRQTRISLDEEQAGKLVSYLGARANVLEDYIEETKRLQPHDEIEDEEQDEE